MHTTDADVLNMNRTSPFFPLAFAPSPLLSSPLSFQRRNHSQTFLASPQASERWINLRRSQFAPLLLHGKIRFEVDVVPKLSRRSEIRLGLTEPEDLFDFRMDPVPLEAEFVVPDVATTSVGWFENDLFVDQVQFELWTEIECLARNVRTRISKLDADVLSELKKGMEDHQTRLSEVTPDSETTLNPTLYSLYLGWEKVLNALHSKRPKISFVAGWSCGTYMFEKLFREEEFRDYDPNDLILTEEVKIPDFSIVEGRSYNVYRKENYFPIVSFELKGPLRRSSPMEEDSTDMAEQFVTFLQDVFNRKAEDIYGVGQIVSQAIIEALLTYSGCAVLYCHSWCRAIYISELTPEKVKVKISRAFLCDEEISASLVALTCFDYALSIVEPGGKKVKRNLKNLFKLYRAGQRIGNNLEQVPQVEGARETTYRAGGKGQSRSGRNSKSIIDGLYTSFDGHQWESYQIPIDWSRLQRGGVLTKQKLERKHWVEHLHEDIVKSRVPLVYMKSSAWRGQGFWENLLLAIEKWENNDVVDEVLRTAARVIGKGGSGLVKRGRYCKSEVAVKFWNRENPEQAPLMRNEVAMYSYLATYHSQIMGRAVPRLIASASHWWHGTVLVTEMVGDSVVVSKDGSLYVGEYAVFEEDRSEIYRLAEEYLRALHSCGVCHGDVSLRNLRAEKQLARNGLSDQKWDLWWVDLGTSYFTNNPVRAEGEIERLREVMKVGL